MKEDLDRNESNKKLNYYLLEGNLLYYCTDLKLRIKVIEGAAESLTGCSLDRLMSEGFHWQELIHPEDLKSYETTNHYLIEEPDRKISRDYRIITPGGALRWIREKARVVTDETEKESVIEGLIQDITEYKRIEKKLLEKTLHLDSILASMQDVVWSVTPDTFDLVYINRAAESVYGYPQEHMLANPQLWSEIVHPDDRSLFLDLFPLLLERGSFESEYRIVRPNGETRYISRRANFGRDADGDVARIDGIDSDITDRKLSDAALRSSEARYRSLVETSPDAILMLDLAGDIIMANGVTARMLAYPTAASLAGVNIFSIIDPSDYDRAKHELKELFRKESSHNILYRMTSADGRSFPVEISTRLLRDAESIPSGFIVVGRDVTARMAYEEKLLHVSMHDTLTGLHNRAYFEEEMERQKSGRRLPLGLVICDVDGLKLVNDLLGHQAGDRLLIAAARVIEKAFRTDDVVARIGGDEFAIILSGCNDYHVTESCERLRRELDKYNASHADIFLSISVGAASTSDYPVDLTRLFSEADNHMYQYKATNKEKNRALIMQSIERESTSSQTEEI